LDCPIKVDGSDGALAAKIDISEALLEEAPALSREPTLIAIATVTIAAENAPAGRNKIANRPSKIDVLLAVARRSRIARQTFVSKFAGRAGAWLSRPSFSKASSRLLFLMIFFNEAFFAIPQNLLPVLKRACRADF